EFFTAASTWLGPEFRTATRAWQLGPSLPEKIFDLLRQPIVEIVRKNELSLCRAKLELRPLGVDSHKLRYRLPSPGDHHFFSEAAFFNSLQRWVLASWMLTSMSPY